MHGAAPGTIAAAPTRAANDDLGGECRFSLQRQATNEGRKHQVAGIKGWMPDWRVFCFGPLKNDFLQIVRRKSAFPTAVTLCEGVFTHGSSTGHQTAENRPRSLSVAITPQILFVVAVAGAAAVGCAHAVCTGEVGGKGVL